MTGGGAKEALKSLYELAHYKYRLPLHVMVIKSWLGGVYLSFGGLLAAQMAAGFLASNAGVSAVLYALFFPVGLVTIVLGESDLYTSNCMIFAIGVLFDLKRVTLFPTKSTGGKSTLSILYIVFLLVNSWVWNFIGSLCISYFLVVASGMVVQGGVLSNFLIALARKKLLLTSDAVFLRAISANMLVCIAVFFSNTTSDTLTKVVVIWLPISTFVGIGGEHSIANMFSIPTGIQSSAGSDDAVSWAAFFLKNIFQVSVGNFFGAMVIALVYFIMYGEQGVEEGFVVLNRQVNLDTSSLRAKMDDNA